MAELYQTLKRSISSTSNNIRRLSGQTQPLKDKDARWIHPSASLVHGYVEYSVKYIGETEVGEPKGSHVVRDAINAIGFKLSSCSVDVNFHATVAPKPYKVDIRINIDKLTVVLSSNKKIMSSHPLNKISFCADDKKDKNIWAFIALNENNRHTCYIFSCNKNAENITRTVGQACDLAYGKYIEKQTVKVNPVEIKDDKKRIEFLERENRDLKGIIENLKKKYSIADEDLRLPSGLPIAPMSALPSLPEPLAQQLIPTSPVPLPPVGYRNGDSSLLPLVPPPSSGRRGPSKMPSTPGNPLADLDLSGPEVGRKLENLNMDKMDNVFDDDFDPRAGEKKELNTSKSDDIQAADEEVQNIQTLLQNCDFRINEMQNFQDVHESNGDKSVPKFDDEYAQPKSSTQKQFSPAQ